MKVITIFGTRPEAIKMAPLVIALEANDYFESLVCVTGQHREMLDQVLAVFDIVPDYDLNVMMKGQDLTDITSRVMSGLRDFFKQERPDMILVHGDTTTTLAASLAGFYAQIPVGHVEAGLRTGNLYSPYPEEANRRLTGVLCNLHFTPTQTAADNLLREGVSSCSIEVTGNTVIDALFRASEIIENDPSISTSMQSQFDFIDPHKRLILVTGHRRESFGGGFEQVCQALAQISAKYEDVQIVYPVHLNPNVREPVFRILSELENVYLIEPLEYLSFVYLMEKSYLLLTDSGGIQEEAPSFGKPVLVMRETTERSEAIAAGTAKLVGTDMDKIVSTASLLLDDTEEYQTMSKSLNPYGHGKACSKIMEKLKSYHLNKVNQG